MDRLRQRSNAPPDPPLEATRKFLLGYCVDEGTIQNIREDVRRMLAINPVTITAGLAGIEGLLADPPAEGGTLLRLVVVEGGKVLIDNSDAGAQAWLEALAQMLREELAAGRP